MNLKNSTNLASSQKSYSGIFTALITPFLPDGSIDWIAFEKLIQEQFSLGLHGLVICGTTAESPTLSLDEKKQLITRALTLRHQLVQSTGTPLTEVPKKFKIIAGTGGADTLSTLQLTLWAQQAGVDACLIVTPYYNKPSQEGLYQHYAKILSESSVDVILYNVPSRTGVSLQPATIERLNSFQHLVAIKEASGNLEAASEILNRSPQLTVLSGDDALFYPGLAIGMKGIISVASHLPSVAKKMLELYETYSHSPKIAQSIHLKLLPISQALFTEPNPAPVKYLLSVKSRCHNILRLPLVPVSSFFQEKILSAYESIKIT
jgi:4-hydroxy-tetrahydrodipicolinate synthase